MTFRQLTASDRDDARPVSRRDFLRLRVNEGRRVLELSCERLFMRYHDACSEAASRQVSNHEDLPGGGEQLTGFETVSPDALLDTLERALGEADELKILERDWLGSDAFGREVGARVDAFRERGGRVWTATDGVQA